MKRVNVTLRMALGGAVCGGYVGILLGAMAGVVYGLFVQNLSFGLDGAMLGGAVAACGGALLGFILGVIERRRAQAALEPPPRPQAPA